MCVCICTCNSVYCQSRYSLCPSYRLCMFKCDVLINLYCLSETTIEDWCHTCSLMEIFVLHHLFLVAVHSGYVTGFHAGFGLHAQTVSQQWLESWSFQYGPPAFSTTDCHAEPASTDSPVPISK